jgi:hypothetical protein
VNRPVVRAVLAMLVVIFGVAYLWISKAQPEVVQTGALVYIAFLMTIAVVSRWL